ncbi:MAG: lysine exporter LysO family protein [Deltaproteobacteria bacterium]|nr:lysine exporter LysO family protein [Deltaproteobacteria bacterium]
MKNSLIILMFFVAGIVSGLFAPIPRVIPESGLSLYVLYVLMFLVGVTIGADTTAWKMIKSFRGKIFLVPLSVIIGTLTGVGLVSISINSLSLKESLAVGAGFGYYSLSSILITEISGETLGIIALLSNIFREIITLVASPLFAAYCHKLAPIASGGATSMDTTLPIIVKTVGKNYAVISIVSGTILTILVPFIVTFILKV